MTERYNRVAMALHWLIALLMIPMLFFGEDLMNKHGGPALPSLHVTIGVTILILTLVRLAWRIAHPPPPLPETMPGWEKAASKASHALFYFLLIALPLTGWLAFPKFLLESKIAGIRFFGLFTVPVTPDLGLPFGLLHSLGGKLGIGLLILHVAAALKHHFYNRDNVLRRMLP